MIHSLALTSLRKQGPSWLRSFAKLWVPAFAGMAMWGCTPAGPINTPYKVHPTIVSLNPCTDAILAEVTAPGQLLAISHYSHDPKSSSMDIAKARQFAVTGGTVEEVLALQPDIVVAGSFMPPATRQALDGLGIRVETVGIASSVEDSRAQIRALALLAGDTTKGEMLVRDIDQAVVQATDANSSVSTVLWQPSGIVPGEGALVSELMRIAGFSSLSAARGMGQADYLSLEQMLADPPQALLLAGQERSQQHPALKQLNATHIAAFDASLLYCGGPTIIRALDRLKAIKEASSP